PASAERFTVNFSKASDEKKTKKASGNSRVSTPHINQSSDHNNHHDNSQNSKSKKWLCFR
ncbi:unnamed protein product, partial [Brassica oleracea var. botrytis]